MFVIDTVEGTFKVTFQDVKDHFFKIPTSDGTKPRLVKRDGIMANVSLLDKEETAKLNDGRKAWQHLFSGFAALHPDESLRGSRNTGRKVALTRALKVSLLTKTERTQFWAAYFAARGKVN